MCYGVVSSSCSTTGTSCATFFENQRRAWLWRRQAQYILGHKWNPIDEQWIDTEGHVMLASIEKIYVAVDKVGISSLSIARRDRKTPSSKLPPNIQVLIRKLRWILCINQGSMHKPIIKSGIIVGYAWVWMSLKSFIRIHTGMVFIANIRTAYIRVN